MSFLSKNVLVVFTIFSLYLSQTALADLSFLLPKSVELVELTGHEFYKPAGPNDVIVGINSNNSDFQNDVAADIFGYVTGNTFHDGKNVFSLTANSPEHVIQSLMSIYKTHGPITKFLLLAHGEPGIMHFPSGQLDLGWYLAHRRSLIKLPKDLFAPGATIVLASCNLAAGDSSDPKKNIRFIRSMFGSLLKQGGTIVASRQIINADSQSDKSPERIRSSQNSDEQIEKWFEKHPIRGRILAFTALSLMAWHKYVVMPVTYDARTNEGRGNVVRIHVPPR